MVQTPDIWLKRCEAHSAMPRQSELARGAGGPTGLCRWQRRVSGPRVSHPRTPPRWQRRLPTRTSWSPTATESLSSQTFQAYPNRINEKKRYERLKSIPQHRHRPCCGRRRRPSRPLLMAETAVWVPYESPAHVRATASSTVDVDLMVSVDGTGFASGSANLHAARCRSIL